MTSIFRMPLQRTLTEKRQGIPAFVELPMDLENRARQNHGNQSYRQLAEGHGLAPSEALAILDDRDYKFMAADQVLEAFITRGIELKQHGAFL